MHDRCDLHPHCNGNARCNLEHPGQLSLRCQHGEFYRDRDCISPLALFKWPILCEAGAFGEHVPKTEYRTRATVELLTFSSLRVTSDP